MCGEESAAALVLLVVVVAVVVVLLGACFVWLPRLVLCSAYCLCLVMALNVMLRRRQRLELSSIPQ